jgi:hypothetical protein
MLECDSLGVGLVETRLLGLRRGPERSDRRRGRARRRRTGRPGEGEGDGRYGGQNGDTTEVG